MSVRYISEHLSTLVKLRAKDRCEYCHLSQQFQEAAFHIDHVLPLARGGKTVFPNLALACVSCSLRKGARVGYRDAQARKLSRLFNPRRDHWKDHFAITWDWRIKGRTTIGRATVEALGMNRSTIILIRRELALAGLMSKEP